MTTPIEVRVRIMDTWEEHSFRLPPDALVSDLKREALLRSRLRHAPEEYELKYRGALVDEGQSTLAEAGVESGAAVIILPRRRRPAK